jgi:hypothetical protein
VKLQEDLRSGELPLHMLPADLYEVVVQIGKRLVYRHPVAQHGEVALLLLLRRAARQPAPGLAPILAAPHGGRAAGTGSGRGIQGYDVHRVRIVRVDDDGEAEVGGEALGNRPPRVSER